MRIVIEGAALRGAGSSLVGQEIVKNLLANYAGNEYFFYIPASWEITDTLARYTCDGSRLSVVPCRAGLTGKALSEFYQIPRLCAKVEIDVLFSLGDTGSPFCYKPHLLLVQQAFLAIEKHEIDFPLDVATTLRLSVMSRYFQSGLHRVTKFTVQSEFMKRKLALRWSIDPARIDVIPSAPAPEITSLRCSPRRDQTPYFVCLTNALPYKNNDVVPGILRRLVDYGIDCKCVLTLREDELPDLARQAEKLGVLKLIDFRGFVARLEAAQLLEGATAHVMPSKLESFGLGYVESMAIGCPLVVADREFSRDICGDAALYAAADSSDAFGDHVASLISSPDFWIDRSKAARLRYQQIGVTWREIASKYHTILQEIALS